MLRTFLFMFTAIPFLLVGCGTDMESTVTGKVTMDGAPLSNASVTFIPVEEGPRGDGMTNEQGEYTLSAGRSGGISPGKYKVMISTAVTTLDGEVEKTMKETVPKKYNTATELNVDVTAGENKLDFSLEK